LSPSRRGVVVIGVGNALRGDDAVGLEVVRRLSDLHREGGIEVVAHRDAPVALVDRWERAAAVVLIDSMRSHAGPGTTTRIDASSEPIPIPLGATSSHGVGVAEAIELARVLGILPPTVVVYGVEGACYQAGAPLSASVAAAVDEVAGAVCREALGLAESAIAACAAATRAIGRRKGEQLT
jgi:hydrogenase maturation protease